MSKFLRMVLTWMLAVALPLQGYAVHAMAACGPAHHRPAAAVAEMAQMAQMAQMPSHHHDGAAAEHHATATDQAEAADDPAASDGKSAQASKCSVCASCCNAAAIAVATFNLDLVPVMPVTVATVPVVHDRMLPGGLERPPRLLLA